VVFLLQMPRTLPKASAAEPMFALADFPVPTVYASHRIIRDCNEAFAGLFASTRAAIVVQSFARLYPEIDDFIRTGEQWAANLAGRRIYHDERVMARLDGERFWCRVHGRSLSAHDDPFERAIYCFEPVARPVDRTGVVLTERQRQILAQVAQGKTNAEIASEIGLSRRTVEAHRARLMKAMQLRNGAELVSWFSSAGSAS